MASPGLHIMFASIVLAAVSLEAEPASPLTVKKVGSGFQLPIFVTTPPGDTNRLFIVEQHTGRIRILNPETQTVEAQPFLTVPSLTGGGEQGLLGLAFHPNYSSNGLFFVNYTTTGGGGAGHTEIARFQVQGDPLTSNVAELTSKSIILTFNQPEANHNGGWVGFGPDGFLYISTGDGGGGNDVHGSIGNAQNRNTLLGKILRIDVDQTATYGIPAGNPFAGVAEQRGEIWAFGLRNPWRCGFDRLTGDLWIGDVGQGAREEIDFNPSGVGGLNFGWRPREGLIQNSAYPSETPVTTPVEPVHDYARSFGVAVTGGYVYRGSAIAGLQGTYLFADYSSARFWSFRSDGTNKLDFVERTRELNAGNPKPIGNASSFGEDAAGELYICDLADGEIYKIVGEQIAAEISLSTMGVTDSLFSFAFTGVPAQAYVVEATEAFPATAWQTVTNLTATAASTNLVVTDAVGAAPRFYRVRTE